MCCMYIFLLILESKTKLQLKQAYNFKNYPLHTNLITLKKVNLI